jgi:hypothetical protein
MSKEKKKKEIKFNPAGYKYMDDMPLEGWIWEFLRRSTLYRNSYIDFLYFHKHQKSLPYNEVKRYQEKLIKDMRYFQPFFLYDPRKKWVSANRHRIIHLNDLSKFNPVLTINMGKDPNAIKRQGYFVTKQKRIHLGAKTKEGYTIQPENYKSLIFTSDPSEIVNCFKSQSNIVMALIDISVPESIEKLLSNLKRRLVEMRKALKLPKARAVKMAKQNKNLLLKNNKIWKSYLIVYDLVKKGGSFEEVSNKLSIYDDKSKNFYRETKNIERHYKSAVRMINSGYKKYL